MFSGKAVLITGASSGLGRAMAVAFAKEGADVGVLARRMELLLELEKEISLFGGYAIPIQADLSDSSSLLKAFNIFIGKTGRLDVLINNAAAGAFGREPSEEEYRAIYDTNVHAVYKLSQLAIPELAKSKGTIINIGSSVTERPFAGELIYTATKGAVNALTKAMAVTYGNLGIRVNLIQPGVIASEFNVSAGLPPEVDKMAYDNSVHLNALPLKGVANDVAGAALFLASDQARFITGEVLKVDGGITLAGIK